MSVIAFEKDCSGLLIHWELVNPDDDYCEYDQEEFPVDEDGEPMPMYVYKESPNCMAKYWVSLNYVKRNLVEKNKIYDTEFRENWAGEFDYSN